MKSKKELEIFEAIKVAPEPGVTEDIVLGHGVVLAVLDDNFGLIYGPKSAEPGGGRL